MFRLISFARLPICLFSLTAVCVAFAEGNQPLSIETAVLPPTSLARFPGAGDEQNLERARPSGLRRADLPAIGSGLASVGENEFIAITDRGPNFTVKIAGGKSRRIFPLPQFAPAIVRFKVNNGAIELLSITPLRGGDGRLLTGLNTGDDEEVCYDSFTATSPLPSDPGGVDPEGIRVFPDGRFLVSEEYSPSLLVVETNGNVLVRYTPEGKILSGAPYPVKPILPSVLSRRRDNRGFECVALSRDGKTAYAILQSPAGKEGDKDFNNSLVSRAIRLDVSDPLNARVTGHFLVPVHLGAEFATKQNQQNVKLNDAEWLSPDRLLVLEQAKDEARLLIVNFSKATNLMGHKDENTLEFEKLEEKLDELTVQPAHVETWFSTKGVKEITSDKLEGLAVIGPQEIDLSNDNDFGVGDNLAGEPSRVWILKMSKRLP